MTVTTGTQTTVRLAVDIPMGWYQIGWEGELAPGGVKPLTVFGEDFVLYRDTAGEFHLMAAYCGHMGAHLGYGGEVKDDCIVCPYHGWAWNSAGKVVDVPYSSRVNRARRLKTLPIRVVSGLIFAWYHVDGADPVWDDPMPAIAEHGSPNYYPIYPHAVREEPLPGGHPQFVVENQVDGAHLVHVHKWAEYIQLDGYGPDGYSFSSRMRGTLNTKRGPVGQAVEITAWGVGIVISRHGFDFGTADSADADADASGEVTTICTTPTSPGNATMRMTAWLPRSDGDEGDQPTGTAAVMLRGAHREVFERDWQIWEHMRYTQRPAYAREEGRAFAEVRNWTAKFYPAAPAAQ
ncbi:Rieske 2Fe-2S domain-containing protein [Gordonia sp. TBRC 11910]|uniref:cholesterol 7-desaturase n=1 Tax=Gordonia asplenii TaxID=2725283 RepID=A0A848KWE8_9ACTN|nr:Rieske 2Fe-2S domain-containing protein [Gordonia asplenii]NMO02920.1 Rieske 2Fe-2S domain-containing protein [Gordonia asplenii]